MAAIDANGTWQRGQDGPSNGAIRSQHRRQKNGTGSSRSAVSQVAQTAGKRIRQALRRAVANRDGISRSANGVFQVGNRIVSILNLLWKSRATVKVVAVRMDVIYEGAGHDAPDVAHRERIEQAPVGCGDGSRSSWCG